MSNLTVDEQTVAVRDIEVFADDLDVERAAAIYREHGCLVVRGLMKLHLADVQRDIEAYAAQSLSLLPQAKEVPGGWQTPDGTKFIAAPPGYHRDKQIMYLSISLRHSAALLYCTLNAQTLDIVEAILGPNIELLETAPVLYKEPVGGYPKHLHQDAAYFEHKFEGPVAVLNYVVDTDLINGALYVVPGSHKMQVLDHVDTSSHLGLDSNEWPWESALPICGAAGDAIFFHVKTIHGSQENHSDKPRPVVLNRYRRPDDYAIIAGYSVESRAESEKRAAAARKDEAQTGLMVRGFRAYAG